MTEDNQRSVSEQEPGFGRGAGRGRRGGQGRNLGGSRSGGNCVCPTCDHKEIHKAGKPCFELKCPTCGTALNRE